MFARFCILLSFVLFIIGCAKVSSPSGGPRDRQAPKVVKSIPVSGAVNFSGNKIVITFDEFIVLDNISEKLMISPPLKKKPIVITRGKNLHVEFDEKLKDSTTYTIYFQDAIKDLNEGNILDNYQFVFSTGKVIDSLSVTGNVYNALNLEVPEKTLVLLYRELADSAVKKHLPDYISRVNADGYFQINNIRAGNYRLYALKDIDNNKNYNLWDEEFAFLNSPITITSEKNFIKQVKDTLAAKKTISKVTEAKTTENLAAIVPEPKILTGEYQLILFTAPKKNHYLTGSSRDLKYLLTYTLSLPPDSLKFNFSIPGSSDNSYFIEENTNKDTVRVWLTDSTLYSQPQLSTIIKYPFTDSLNRILYKEDTVLLRYTAPRAPRVAKVQKPSLNIETNISSGFLKPGQIIVFKSQTPFNKPDTSRIRLYELKDSTKQRVIYQLTKDTANSCKYYFTANLLQGKKYLFVALRSSFSNIYNEYSDSIGAKFTLKDPESYNQLTLNIKNYSGDRIIQLLTSSESIISEIYQKKDGKLVFPLLEAGAYRIRVIYDLNGNRKWDTGDFDSRQQPEPVSFYFQNLEIKSGWSPEQDWDIGKMNFKDPKLWQKTKTR
jgi:hypothetical protein